MSMKLVIDDMAIDWPEFPCDSTDIFDSSFNTADFVLFEKFSIYYTLTTLLSDDRCRSLWANMSSSDEWLKL